MVVACSVRFCAMCVTAQRLTKCTCRQRQRQLPFSLATKSLAARACKATGTVCVCVRVAGPERMTQHSLSRVHWCCARTRGSTDHCGTRRWLPASRPPCPLTLQDVPKPQHRSCAALDGHSGQCPVTCVITTPVVHVSPGVRRWHQGPNGCASAASTGAALLGQLARWAQPSTTRVRANEKTPMQRAPGPDPPPCRGNKNAYC